MTRCLPLIALVCASCLPGAISAEEIAAAAAAGEVKSFTYKTTPQGKLDMHVHFPTDWKASDKRPAIVFFFGGGWARGTVKQFEPQAKYLAMRGMVAARADYRVKSRHGVSPVACVEDAKSAVRWLRSHARELGIDSKRIVASGGSAGGHIAACTGTTPGLDARSEDGEISSRPSAMILFNPVLRFAGVEALEGRLGRNSKPLAPAISPTLQLNADSPPAILFFGDRDRLLTQGREYVKAAAAKGVRAEIDIAEGRGHGYFNRSPWFERTLQRADKFLASLGYVEGEPTVKLPASP